MKKKENVIFSNYYNDTHYNNYEEDFKEWCEMNELEETKENLNEFLSINEEGEYDSFRFDMERFMLSKTFVLTGEVGTWSGKVKGGMIIETFNSLMEAIEECDHIKISDNGGHLYVYGSHHNGNNCYELRQLNDKGIKLLENNNYRLSRKDLCETLFTSTYSKLPHVAKILYGC